MTPAREGNPFRLTRRRFVNLGCLGGIVSGGAVALLECARLGGDSRSAVELEGTSLASVHVANFNRIEGGRAAELGGFVARQMKIDLEDKAVCLQSSFLAGHRDHVVASYMEAIGSMANSFAQIGAKSVILSTNVARYQGRHSGFTVACCGEGHGDRVPIFCSTRQSGLLRVEIPPWVPAADVFISEPLSEPVGLPLLASTNLLGLVAGHEHSPPNVGMLGGAIGKLIVDLVCTIKPRYCINFMVGGKALDDSFTVVMGSETSSVDAVMCLERGVDPDLIAPLRDLPAWIGPTSPDRIRVRRHVPWTA